MKARLSRLAAVAAILSYTIAVDAQTVTTITEEFNASGDLEVGPDGNIYVADFGPSLSTGGGTNVYQVTREGEVSVFATGLFGASGNGFDSEGNLYQSNISASTVSKITPDGTVSNYAFGPAISGPVGVVVDPAGNVYNTNCGSNTISRTPPGGTPATFAANNLLSCPNGLTIDDEGNLYTSNFNNCNVMKINSLGEVTRLGCASTFDAPNAGNGHITFANERLYVAGWRSGVIYEMPLQGSPVTVLAGAGGSGREDGPANVARFHQPNGVDATPTGDTLYVNDTVNLASSGSLLHPNVVRMITGVNSVNTSTDEDVPGDLELEVVGTFPNPAHDVVNVEFRVGIHSNIRLDVVDMLGRTVKQAFTTLRRPGRHQAQIDVSPLPAGLYMVRASTLGETRSSPFVITR